MAHDRDRDPLVGNHDEAAAAGFTIPGAPPRRITGLQNFVTMKGGEYFFVPGLRARRYLAGDPDQERA